MNRASTKFTAVFGALIILGTNATTFAGDLVLWYQQPVGSAINQALAGGKASPFVNEALPIGNGRIGGLIAGDTAREQIVLNEDSLWTGGENPSGDDNTMGAYQCLGDVFINLPGHENLADYRRDLDIGERAGTRQLPIGRCELPPRIFLQPSRRRLRRAAHRRPARQLHRQH